MAAKRLVITGRVQGVGYREWMVYKATSLGVVGWVRNRGDGSVEALVDGEVASVEELLRACRRGPRLAEVHEIDEHIEELDEEELSEPGFRRLPSL
jgi:acylphosphatase